MKILLHMCCGPCTIYPFSVLNDAGHTVQGYFFNPNIHPFQEFTKRMNAVEALADKWDINIDYCRDYGLKEFIRKVVFNENKRCEICYDLRLKSVVRHAKEIRADAFSTTLLYSKFQKHDVIRNKAEKIAEQEGIPFYYEDFRKGWQQGIDVSKELELYRQSYCGCIYSEQERYDKKLHKKKGKTNS